MSEGFEQSTDAVLANYLYTSKSSIAEVVARLKGAQRRGWVTAAECAQCAALGAEIQRMLGGWIKYLNAATGRTAGGSVWSSRLSDDSGLIRDSGPDQRLGRGIGDS